MATPLEKLLLDTVYLIEAIVEEDFDEARFRCNSIVTLSRAEQMVKISETAEELLVCLHATNLAGYRQHDEVLPKLIALVEVESAPLRQACSRTL